MNHLDSSRSGCLSPRPPRARREKMGVSITFVDSVASPLKPAPPTSQPANTSHQGQQPQLPLQAPSLPALQPPSSQRFGSKAPHLTPPSFSANSLVDVVGSGTSHPGSPPTATPAEAAAGGSVVAARSTKDFGDDRIVLAEGGTATEEQPLTPSVSQLGHFGLLLDPSKTGMEVNRPTITSPTWNASGVASTVALPPPRIVAVTAAASLHHAHALPLIPLPATTTLPSARLPVVAAGASRRREPNAPVGGNLSRHSSFSHRRLNSFQLRRGTSWGRGAPAGLPLSAGVASAATAATTASLTGKLVGAAGGAGAGGEPVDERQRPQPHSEVAPGEDVLFYATNLLQATVQRADKTAAAQRSQLSVDTIVKRLTGVDGSGRSAAPGLPKGNSVLTINHAGLVWPGGAVGDEAAGKAGAAGASNNKEKALQSLSRSKQMRHEMHEFEAHFRQSLHGLRQIRQRWRHARRQKPGKTGEQSCDTPVAMLASSEMATSRGDVVATPRHLSCTSDEDDTDAAYWDAWGGGGVGKRSTALAARRGRRVVHDVPQGDKEHLGRRDGHGAAVVAKVCDELDRKAVLHGAFTRGAVERCYERAARDWAELQKVQLENADVSMTLRREIARSQAQLALARRAPPRPVQHDRRAGAQRHSPYTTDGRSTKRPTSASTLTPSASTPAAAVSPSLDGDVSWGAYSSQSRPMTGRSRTLTNNTSSVLNSAITDAIPDVGDADSHPPPPPLPPPGQLHSADGSETLPHVSARSSAATASSPASLLTAAAAPGAVAAQASPADNRGGSDGAAQNDLVQLPPLTGHSSPTTRGADGLPDLTSVEAAAASVPPPTHHLSTSEGTALMERQLRALLEKSNGYNLHGGPEAHRGAASRPSRTTRRPSVAPVTDADHALPLTSPRRAVADTRRVNFRTPGTSPTRQPRRAPQAQTARPFQVRRRRGRVPLPAVPGIGDCAAALMRRQTLQARLGEWQLAQREATTLQHTCDLLRQLRPMREALLQRDLLAGHDARPPSEWAKSNAAAAHSPTRPPLLLPPLASGADTAPGTSSLAVTEDATSPEPTAMALAVMSAGHATAQPVTRFSHPMQIMERHSAAIFKAAWDIDEEERRQARLQYVDLVSVMSRGSVADADWPAAEAALAHSRRLLCDRPHEQNVHGFYALTGHFTLEQLVRWPIQELLQRLAALFKVSTAQYKSWSAALYEQYNNARDYEARFHEVDRRTHTQGLPQGARLRLTLHSCRGLPRVEGGRAGLAGAASAAAGGAEATRSTTDAEGKVAANASPTSSPSDASLAVAQTARRRMEALYSVRLQSARQLLSSSAVPAGKPRLALLSTARDAAGGRGQDDATLSDPGRLLHGESSPRRLSYPTDSLDESEHGEGRPFMTRPAGDAAPAPTPTTTTAARKHMVNFDGQILQVYLPDMHSPVQVQLLRDDNIIASAVLPVGRLINMPATPIWLPLTTSAMSKTELQVTVEILL